MISNEDLTKKAMEYKSKFNGQFSLTKFNSLINKFQTEFSKEKLKNLTLEDYAAGLENISFSNWIEVETKEIANMYGGSAGKFGVYFHKADKRWRDRNHKTISKEEANKLFLKIKQGILKIIELAKDNKFSEIDELDMECWPIVKSKIIYLYFPENKITSIMNQNDVKQVCKLLDVPFEKEHTILSNHRLLEHIKKMNLFSNWDTNEIGHFFYEMFNLKRDVDYWIFDQKEGSPYNKDIIGKQYHWTNVVSTKVKEGDEFVNREPGSSSIFGYGKVGNIISKDKTDPSNPRLKTEYICEIIDYVQLQPPLNLRDKSVWPDFNFLKNKESLAGVFNQSGITNIEKKDFQNLINRQLDVKQIQLYSERGRSEGYLSNINKTISNKVDTNKIESIITLIKDQLKFSDLKNFLESNKDNIYAWGSTTRRGIVEEMKSGDFMIFSVQEKIRYIGKITFVGGNEDYNSIKAEISKILWDEAGYGYFWFLKDIKEVDVYKSHLEEKYSFNFPKSQSHLDRFNDFLDNEKIIGIINELYGGLGEMRNIRYWKISPGENAKYWDEFLKNGFSAINWAPYEDISKLTDGELLSKIKSAKQGGDVNHIFRMFKLLKEIKIGDIIVSNDGLKKIIGWGVVKKSYYFKTDSEENQHRINVEWKSSKKKEFDNNMFLRNTIQELNKDIFNRLIDSSIVKLESKENTMELDSKEKILEHIYRYINSRGFVFDKKMLVNFYLSLKTKPFVILAGISGTGKSKLIKHFAGAVGSNTNNNRFRLISVKPNWSDNTDLIGYQDVFQNSRFRPGEIIDILIAATHEPSKMFFICLDEMNLARVEYYFSDFLSKMEDREWKDSRIETPDIISQSDIESLQKTDPNKTEVKVLSKLTVPDNVYFVGTVNMDETTHPFSKKVLDRANSIEFSEIDLEYITPEGEEEKPIEINNEFLRAEFLILKDLIQRDKAVFDKWNPEIIKINDILKQASLHFGYRIREEMLIYMHHQKEVSSILNEDDAFDFQIIQKILPRIQGRDMSIRKVLIELLKYCAIPADFSDINEDTDYETLKTRFKDFVYKRSSQKLMEMIKKHIIDGYTTFWLM